MRQFSLGGAWTKGFGFFSGQAANHAIVLIGIGIVAPFVLQYLLIGGPMAMMNPAAMAQQGGLGGLAAMGGVTILVMTVVTYVLQMGSYFASWRLGLSEGETLPDALGYGLVAGLMAVLAFALVGILGVAVAQVQMVVGIILIVVALLPLFAMLYTAIAAVVAVGMVLVLLIMLAVGSATDQPNPAFALAGGGGLSIAIFLAITALLLWLTARFSCVTPVLAARRTFNLLEAVKESWRLTSAGQWRIMLYLALLGVVLLVAFVIVGALVGIGMVSSMQSGGVPQLGLGTAIAALIVGIPFAYLAVLVPAGIYRELADEAAPAKVFA